MDPENEGEAQRRRQFILQCEVEWEEGEDDGPRVEVTWEEMLDALGKGRAMAAGGGACNIVLSMWRTAPIELKIRVMQHFRMYINESGPATSSG